MASVRGLRRWLAPAGVVIVLGGCVALFWLSGRALDEPFVAPGAEDVAITQSSLDTRQISYQMPGPDDAWQSTVARRLSNSGWRLSHAHYTWGDTEHYVPIYVRTSQVWVVTLSEQATLSGDRQHAVITVRYTTDPPGS